ncbi:type II toxin-antitoxin system VapC family toxin [Candidatus Woesearchaeota archaeon]|nr:type II toxin-antitoxin system VapC family toxin [Candidatus Woesearchaeota archaeon]
MKIVDTDIFIDLFRGLELSRQFFAENEEIIFSAITEAELLSGQQCKDAAVREKILHFLSQFEKITVGNPLVQIAADFRRKYGIALPDAIIAASAFVHNATLITRNLKDFQKIREIKVEKPY